MQKPVGLPPYPNGWFAFGFSDELASGSVLSRPFMGEDLVVYRTRSGLARAVDPYCPHLGAHLGHGGRIDGELLVCPFHGFAYDVGGACARTGYGSKPPPAARLGQRPLRETNGLLLVYHDSAGREPGWEVPELEAEGWTRLRRRSFVLRDHPQETTENSVDLGHFAFVHGYRDPVMLRDAITDGAYLSTAFSARHGVPFVGGLLPGRTVRFEFETEIYGLGYSLVSVRLPGLGVEARLWVLPTPIDAERLTLRMAASVPTKKRRVLHPALRVVPTPLLHSLLTRFVLGSLVHDAKQDFPIWEHKRYVHRPALAEGDGPIGRYRQWARQFYPGEAARDDRKGAPPGAEHLDRAAARVLPRPSVDRPSA